MEEKKKQTFRLDTENLAVPEVHVNEAQTDMEDFTTDENEKIIYDTLAVPEIIFRKKKDKE